MKQVQLLVDVKSDEVNECLLRLQRNGSTIADIQYSVCTTGNYGVKSNVMIVYE